MSLNLTQNWYSIAFELHTVDAEILKIEWVFVVVDREIGVGYETNYSQVRQNVRKLVFKIKNRCVLGDKKVLNINALIENKK